MELVGAQQDVAFMMEKFEVSERRACELNHIDRSSYRYEPRPDRNADLSRKLTTLARETALGYRRLSVLLEKKGITVNPKRLFRVYQQAGLGVRRRERKRLERGAATMPLFVRPNQQWSMDFVSDALANGRAAWFTSSPANRRRIASSKASTAVFAMSV
jgi:putative transposase